MHKFNDRNGLPTLYAYGWLTGEDNDLICIKPYIGDNTEAQLALSPCCKTRFFALIAFAMKLVLWKLDTNLQV